MDVFVESHKRNRKQKRLISETHKGQLPYFTCLEGDGGETF